MPEDLDVDALLEDQDLVDTAREVKRMVDRGAWSAMQNMVARTAEMRGETNWELARKLAAVGVRLGIAPGIPQQA